jgi:hypothetical protein
LQEIRTLRGQRLWRPRTSRAFLQQRGTRVWLASHQVRQAAFFQSIAEGESQSHAVP